MSAYKLRDLARKDRVLFLRPPWHVRVRRFLRRITFGIVK